MISTKTISLGIICLQLFLLNCEKVGAQTFEWAKQMGSTDWDKGTAVALDDNGNVYCTGDFRGTVDFDPGPGVFNLTAGGTQDLFISKFDASGNLIWAKQIGATGWEESHALALDEDGNIYTAGFFLGATDFDPAAGTFTLNSSFSGDAFISKLDSSGNFVWAKQFGGNLAVTAYALTVDESGNVYTTGFFDGTADFDPGVATYNLSVVGYSDIFVSKLDSSGNFIWAKQLGGADGAVGYSIAADNSGNVLTTGTFFGTVDFDPGIGTFNLSSSGGQEIYISKLDSSGSFIWAKQVGGETGYSIITDNLNAVYTTGYYGWNDISINKLDSSGNILWAKEIGAFVAYSLDIDTGYNVYTTGQFYGTRDFDPGAGIVNLTATGSTDSYINKLDSAGNFAWVKQLGGTDEVLSRAIAADNTGNIYTTGIFNATADFDPGTASFNLTSIGSYDIFLHKMDLTSVGLGENSFADAVKIYPNPNDGNLVIEFDQEHIGTEVILRNIAGQVVDIKSVVYGNRMEIEINESSGIYFLEIPDQNNQKKFVRIIKN